MTEPGDRSYSGDGAGSSDWFSPVERGAAASGGDGDLSSAEPFSEGAWSPPSPGERRATAATSGDIDLSLVEPQAPAPVSGEAAGPAELQLAASASREAAGPAELQLAVSESSEADPTTADTDQPDLPAEFRVRCPECGPQRVAVADVRFVQTGVDAQANRYMFTCPECGERVRRPAGPELAEVLRNAGVATLALHRGSGEAI